MIPTDSITLGVISIGIILVAIYLNGSGAGRRPRH